MKRRAKHTSLMQILTLIFVSTVLLIGVALNTINITSETSLQPFANDVETVSKAHNPANEMKGLLMCEESFRMLLPLYKPTSPRLFQGGTINNFYKNTMLLSSGVVQNYKALEQQFALVKLQNLYIPLRI